MCVGGVGHTPESAAQTSEIAASAAHRNGVVAHTQRAWARIPKMSAT